MNVIRRHKVATVIVAVIVVWAVATLFTTALGTGSSSDPSRGTFTLPK